jgi:hypothetical protein
MINIVIDDRLVRARLDALPEKVHSALLSRITALTSELEARVQASEPARTGALRAETVQSISDKPERIRGTVRVANQFAKAAALEYGSHTTITVNRRRDSMIGRLMKPSANIAGSFTRTTNITEKRYLRGSLDSMASEIESTLRTAIEEALAS